jgi:hypothetical protein
VFFTGKILQGLFKQVFEAFSQSLWYKVSEHSSLSKQGALAADGAYMQG